MQVTRIITQLLAALLSVPNHVGGPVLERLEESDFDDDWRGREVFTALKEAGLPEHENSGAALIRVKDWLLSNGRFNDPARDESLRDYLTELAGIRGDTHNFHHLVDTFLNERYRNLSVTTFSGLADSAHRLPLHDYDKAIARGIEDIRMLRMRLGDNNERPGLKAV